MGNSGRRPRVDRERAIRRYLELRPIVRARLSAAVPAELHKEFESLTPHQLLALLLLPAEGLSMRQLAASLGVMGATVSVLADRLVAQGLAVRKPDPSDRRVVRLAPSERGQALAARAAEQQRRSAAEIFDRLSDAQVVAFLDVLETLAEAQSPGSTGSPCTGPATPQPVSATGAEEMAALSLVRRSSRAPGVRHERAVREEAR